jgi:hypothetical protein
MNELIPVTLQCPYCGETIEILVDTSGDEEYSEDCSVCCEPMAISVIFNGDDLPRVEARQEG